MRMISKLALAAGMVLVAFTQAAFAANSECVKLVGPEWSARHTIDPAVINAPRSLRRRKCSWENSPPGPSRGP